MDDDTTTDEQAYSSSGEDVGRDHIPTVNLRQSWWKPLTEDRPATPEPAWSIPSSDLTVPTNNWASALKSTYTPLPDNLLLAQIGDMATFMDWYCKKQGISELTQKDLEGPAYEIVKVFHPDIVHLQFQMEECHKLLTDQVDDAILRYNVNKPLPLGDNRVEESSWGLRSTRAVKPHKPDGDAKGFEYKHAFTIDEALDYRVKEFRVNRMNPGLDTRFWTKKDVDRSKEFMFAIQKRLKTRRIFRNLESFVGGRIREGDYRLLKRTE
ncbi:hypothetical protein Tco_0983178 [Tanacetum coccineum]